MQAKPLIYPTHNIISGGRINGKKGVLRDTYNALAFCPIYIYIRNSIIPFTALTTPVALIGMRSMLSSTHPQGRSTYPRACGYTAIPTRPSNFQPRSRRGQSMYRAHTESQPKSPAALPPQPLPRLDISPDFLLRQAIGARPIRTARPRPEAMMPLFEHLLHVRTSHRSKDGVRVHVLILRHQQLA